MGLFDKKFCDVCGEKIRFLGNRKLEDGNLCKTCAAKLSPWFDERRHSTVEGIKAQLAYREKNMAQLAGFQATRSFGQGSLTLYLDDRQRKFILCRSGDFMEENPDILDFDQVLACDLDIEESREEVMREIRDSDGERKEVSYQPPRYTYDYDFRMKLRVRHPYFDEMDFQLNRSSVFFDPQDPRFRVLGPIGMPASIPRYPSYPQTGASVNGAADPRMKVPEYAACCKMAEEIRTALLDRSETSATPASAAPLAGQGAPVQPLPGRETAAYMGGQSVVCPYCGAETTPTAAGRCEFCASSLTPNP